MKVPGLFALATVCLLSAAIAGTVEHTVLARGTSGPAESSLLRLNSQEALERWSPGARYCDTHTFVVVGLGEQPAGTEIVGVSAFSKDKYGWANVLRVKATIPHAASETVHPFVVVSLASQSALGVEHSVRARVLLDGVALKPMSLDHVAKTKSKLSAMTRHQRARVIELHNENIVLRGQLVELEKDVLAYANDPAYSAALNGLPFEERLDYVVETAALQADMQLFGSSSNPLISTGDGSLPYLSGKRASWIPELEADYAREASDVRASIAKLQRQLASMQSLAAKAPKPAPQQRTQGVAETLKR